jgi:hypothetical protein
VHCVIPCNHYIFSSMELLAHRKHSLHLNWALTLAAAIGLWQMQVSLDSNSDEDCTSSLLET